MVSKCACAPAPPTIHKFPLCKSAAVSDAMLSLACKHGKCGYLSFILYLSKKYLATVHSTVCPFSSCNGNLQLFTMFTQISKNSRQNILRLHLGRSPSNVTYSVFSPHGPAVGNFNLQTLDLLSKFNPLAVCQWFTLLVNISYI